MRTKSSIRFKKKNYGLDPSYTSIPCDHVVTVFLKMISHEDHNLDVLFYIQQLNVLNEKNLDELWVPAILHPLKDDLI
jgi:hypothetical protein